MQLDKNIFLVVCLLILPNCAVGVFSNKTIYPQTVSTDFSQDFLDPSILDKTRVTQLPSKEKKVTSTLPWPTFTDEDQSKKSSLQIETTNKGILPVSISSKTIPLGLQICSQNKLLLENLEQLQALAKAEAHWSIVYDLSLVLDKIVNLGSGECQKSKRFQQIVSTIKNSTAEVIENVVLRNKNEEFNQTHFNSSLLLTITVVKKIQYLPEKYRNNFLGNSIYNAGDFDISIMCLVSNSTSAGFVIYSENVSSLRPLPFSHYPIKRFKLVDMTLVHVDGHTPSANTQREVQCSDYEYLDMVVFRWTPEFWLPNVKKRCAQWDESIGDWSPGNCRAIESYDTSYQITCFCDMKNNNQTMVEYLIYAYESVFVDNLAKDLTTITNKSDATELKAYEKNISEISLNISERSLHRFIDELLNNVMLFESEILINSDTILADIGKILGKVELDEGDQGDYHIQRRNSILSCYIMMLPFTQLDYKPVGFVMYDDVYFEPLLYTSEDININALFSYHSAFALLFSTSVVQENQRYAFLLYPKNKFFKRADFIDGLKVLQMRVVDIILTPYPTVQGTSDQFVHMYLGSFQTYLKKTEFGCAFWSPSLGHWTTQDCYPNPDLYRSVCTCNMSANFNESRTRFQFINFEYQIADFFKDEGSANLDYMDTEFIEGSVFAINVLKKYPYGQRTVSKLIRLMYLTLLRIDGTYRISEVEKAQLIEDAREILKYNDCAPLSGADETNRFIAMCFDLSANGSSKKVSAFEYKTYANSEINTHSFAEYKAINVFSNDTAVAVHVSESVLTQNVRYAFFMYPYNIFLKPLPQTEGKIIRSRVIDIILVPRNGTVAMDQFVELYFDHSAYNSTLACAFWSPLLDDWTTLGCEIVLINSLSVCNCSLANNHHQSLSGGQYIMLMVSDIIFDEQVYTGLVLENLRDYSTICRQGYELIHNASQLLLDPALIVKLMKVYVIVLTHSEKESDSTILMQICHDLELTFSRYWLDVTIPVKLSLGVQGAWNMKNADVARDMYSNALLSGNETKEVSMVSDMVVGVTGYLVQIDKKTTGVYFTRTKSNMLEFESNAMRQNIWKTNPMFACSVVDPELVRYFRFIFVIYPLNLSPYRYTMTSSPIFNSRQVDIYVDIDNPSKKVFGYLFDDISFKDTIIELYFQPTETPKDYIGIACASWSEVINGWTSEICTMKLENDFSFCRCNITSRPLSRIIIYEFTDIPNFSLSELLEVKSIVYLVGASLSQLGFVIIFATAILFAKWRKELSNKILIHLTTSSFLYLTLTMYRETHLIYADTNHVNVPLIAFTICVHYTRLAYYCWGSALSVLQYRRFSSIAGATTVTHLLLKVSLLAWGAPLVPLAVLLTWNQKAHFSTQNKLTHCVLYLVPGIIITVLNIGLLVAIICTITKCCGFKKIKDLQRHGVDNKDVLLHGLKQATMMFFLFGVPTVFEIFNDLGSHSVVVEYITKVLVPIQGFVIFLFFVVFDNKTRCYWEDLFLSG